MLLHRGRVLESHILEFDLALKLDAHASPRVLMVTNLWHTLNDLEDEGAQGLGSHQTLDVRQCSDKSNKSCNQGNQD